MRRPWGWNGFFRVLTRSWQRHKLKAREVFWKKVYIQLFEVQSSFMASALGTIPNVVQEKM
jgi:hypothetical protein